MNEQEIKQRIKKIDHLLKMIKESKVDLLREYNLLRLERFKLKNMLK